MKKSFPLILLILGMTLLVSRSSAPTADGITKCGVYDEIQKYPLQLEESKDYGSLHIKIRNLTSAKGDLYRWCAEVYKNGSSLPVQIITDSCDDEFGCMSVSRGNIYHTEDVNFDGYQDIYFLESAGATGNAAFNFWIFNPETSQFDYNGDYSAQIFTPTFDKENRQIKSHWKLGSAGGAFSDSIYKVENGQLILLRTIIQDNADKPGIFKRTTEEYQHDKVISTIVENIRLD